LRTTLQFCNANTVFEVKRENMRNRKDFGFAYKTEIESNRLVFLKF
jgi:hypothetical protein